ncbi:hypothetical protein ACFE04_007449 [Oxalis oulophora]
MCLAVDSIESGMPSVREREPPMRNEIDIKFQIHCIEKQAYTSVLRAFIAQSDLLSWGKEGLLTDLRRELCVTDSEHAEILGKIKSDESVHVIRNLQKHVSGNVPNSEGCGFHKKAKVTHFPIEAQSEVSQFQSSSTTFLPTLHAQCQSNQFQAEKDVLLAGNLLKSFSHNYTRPSNNKGSGMEISHAKKDYRAPYLENLEKTSTFIDIRATDTAIQEAQDQAKQVQVEKDVLLAGNSMKSFGHNNPRPSKKKGSALEKFHSKKNCHAPYLGNLEKTSNIIDIRVTDNVIEEVNSMINDKNDRVQIEEAKSILWEHEKSIIVALEKLADVLADPPKKMRRFHCHEQFPANGEGSPTQTGF